MIAVEISDARKERADHQGWRDVIQQIASQAGYHQGCVSVAAVDDATIHALNLQHLAHDYPTDVLSFVLERRLPHLEGEVIVSFETAASQSGEYGAVTGG